MLKRLLFNIMLHHLFAHYAWSNRLAIRENNLYLHATYASCIVYCVSRGRLDKVYIKVDIAKRRKKLKIWLKRSVKVE